MRSPLLLALALAIALAGCAGHKPTPTPEGSAFDATNVLFRLSAADQATAQDIADHLKPGKGSGYFKAESGETVMLQSDSKKTVKIVMYDREGQLVEIVATVERDGDAVQLIRAEKNNWPTAHDKDFAEVCFTLTTRMLRDVPANTPVFVE